MPVQPMPIPAQRVQAGPAYVDTVVPLHSEQALELALFPWRGQATRHARAKLILAFTDLAMLGLCFLIGHMPLWLDEEATFLEVLNLWWVGHGHLWVTLLMGISAGMVVWMGAVYGHYTAARRMPWSDELRQLLTVIAVAAMANAVLNYLGNWPVSRLWTGFSWALVFVLLPLARYSVRRRMLTAGLLTQPYVLIGQPQDVTLAAAALASEPLMGYTPVAVICPEPLPQTLAVGGRNLVPMALSPGARQYLARPGGYQVVAVMPEHNSRWLRDFAQDLMLTRDDITIVPALSGLPMLGMEASHFFSHEVLLLRARNNLQRRIPKMLKRALDVVGALALMCVLSPLLLGVAWLIWREDRGPVLFTQDRVGLGGQRFKFIKFRSMVTDADAALERWKEAEPELYAQYRANNFKLQEDPRITRVGRWIRRTSVDELPQLINVLLGDMSLVGPRPLLPRELPDYGKAIAAYGRARPGITGLWQVSGRSSSTFDHRIAMDLWYVRNWSLWYDIVILLRTVGVVARQEGAC
ncbi:MAG: undecaprenyl-phosphate galactose phosphotransferase WbaP [Hydrogenophaga sp.]|nr:undecaprenyl-phosphate galactose phosphotransferase WbaP [Hydrogenophaga sp.]